VAGAPPFIALIVIPSEAKGLTQIKSVMQATFV